MYNKNGVQQWLEARAISGRWAQAKNGKLKCKN